MPVWLDYRLVGSGWCECELKVDGRGVTVSGSYLSDPLYEFCAAAQALLGGASHLRFSFDEEPGEYRWLLRALDGETVAVSILEFPELWSHAPDSAGKLIFEARCGKRALAEALHSAMSHLLSEHGEEGYQRKWVEYRFPVERYRQLGAALGLGGR